MSRIGIPGDTHGFFIMSPLWKVEWWLRRRRADSTYLPTGGVPLVVIIILTMSHRAGPLPHSLSLSSFDFSFFKDVMLMKMDDIHFKCKNVAKKEASKPHFSIVYFYFCHNQTSNMNIMSLSHVMHQLSTSSQLFVFVYNFELITGGERYNF